MDRVPYRRVQPSRLREDRELVPSSWSHTRQRNHQPVLLAENEEPTGGESLLMQCIVSVVLLAVVFLIALADTGPTVALREGLRQTLSGAETAGELLYEMRFIGEEFLGFGPSPETEPESFPGSFDGHIPFEQNFFEENASHSEFYQLPPQTQPPTTSYTDPNPQIPGLSEVPELRD